MADKHTAVKLAEALAEIPGVPGAMIARARNGYYHDYLSPLPFPDVQLVADLTGLARHPATPRDSRPLLREMAGRVRNGDFDASREEADEWARSAEGQETFRQLLADAQRQPREG